MIVYCFSFGIFFIASKWDLLNQNFIFSYLQTQLNILDYFSEL